MRLPDKLRSALERELESCEHGDLIRASRELSDTYRDTTVRNRPAFQTRTHRLAYLLTRFPATFSSAESAFLQVTQLNPDLSISSVLDVGAGAGAASWAATKVFPHISRLTMIERDRDMTTFAQRFHEATASQASLESVTRPVESVSNFEPHDLVIFSYSFGEIREELCSRILDSAWNATKVLMVIIESGSTRGFSCVLSARTQLLSKGAQIAAPCPHANECPMVAPDWCHFSARVERSRLHRDAKAAALGYEDEKFSFVAVTRNQHVKSAARILRRPLARKGHIRLDLCTKTGLERVTISKKLPAEFRQARHAQWGNPWPLTPDV